MSSNLNPTTNNYGFYGVKDNKLVTDDTELKFLVKYYNHERAKSIKEGNPLDCDSKKWEIYDWYTEHECNKQKNTDHLEEALKRKGVKPDNKKFPIFFGSGNMASLLSPLLFDLSFDYGITKFNFNDKTGLRFTTFDEKVYRSDPHVGEQGHIAEYLLVTSEENECKLIEIGRELTYLINSLEFEGSGVLLFCSKEFDCLWERKNSFDVEDVCEVKAYDGGLSTEYGIQHIQLVVKNFALGRIQRLAVATTTKNFTTISTLQEVKDIKTLNKEETLESFYACLNNFTKLIVRHCRENKLTEGSVETFRRGENKFMVIEDKDHFWCYEYKINSKDFSYRLKFPNSLSAIRWPSKTKCPFFDTNKIDSV